jgi:hypothetical protein
METTQNDFDRPRVDRFTPSTGFLLGRGHGRWNHPYLMFDYGLGPIGVTNNIALLNLDVAKSSGGRVVDRTGAPWFRADVCVIGDKIAGIGNFSQASAKRRVDASDLVVAPGFIDLLGQSEFMALADNRVAGKTAGPAQPIATPGSGRKVN